MAKKQIKKLTAKQERFVEEYLVDLNATQAAIRAGYSEKTAGSISFENLQKPEIQDAIDEKRRQLSEKTGINQSRVLKEYAKLAFLDPSLFYDENGLLIPIQDLPNEVSAALTGIECTRHTLGDGEDRDIEYTTKIKFADKIKALDSLAKHLGLFEKDNDQKRPIIRLLDGDSECL